MKQKYALIFIVLILILLGVSALYKDKKLRDADALSFSNKQKCASYLGDMLKRVKESNQVKVEGFEVYSELEEVWFSEKRNSCLYTIKSQMVFEGSTTTLSSYQILDYLSGQQIPYLGGYDRYVQLRKELE